MIKTVSDIHKMTVEEFGEWNMLNKSIQEFQEIIESIRDIKTGMINGAVTQEMFANLVEELGDGMNITDKLIVMFNLNKADVRSSAKDKMKRTLDLMTKEDYVIDYGGII